jgi:hypothetical protein
MREGATTMLKEFVMGNGRWDLESLQLRVTELFGKRQGAAMDL